MVSASVEDQFVYASHLIAIESPCSSGSVSKQQDKEDRDDDREELQEHGKPAPFVRISSLGVLDPPQKR